MKHIQAILFICITLLISFHNVEGRYHYHKRQKSKGSSPSESPAKSPDPQEKPVPSSPGYSPSVPSDPYPDDPGTSSNTSNCIFDVTSFGAVGDGSADDTAAFREAWKAACAVESGTILVPQDRQFVITSTIFSGPCKPGLVFQVNHWTKFVLINSVWTEQIIRTTKLSLPSYSFFSFFSIRYIFVNY